MSPFIRRWVMRVTVTAAFILAILILIILKPSILYARHSEFKEYGVFHQQPVEAALNKRMLAAIELVRHSELYVPDFHPQLCLNDGSFYPALIERVQGNAFAYGFYKMIILHSNANYRENYAELNGYAYNLEQLLAHEAIHCLQYRRYGLFGSNPMAEHPEWKWEGYAEYIARKRAGINTLEAGIGHLIKTMQTEHNGWIQYPDGTGSMITYYKAWLLTRYCLDTKGMSYDELLADARPEEVVEAEMMKWYGSKSSAAN